MTRIVLASFALTMLSIVALSAIWTAFPGEHEFVETFQELWKPWSLLTFVVVWSVVVLIVQKRFARKGS
jgi:Na+/H+ antiporter NhaB